MTRTISRKDLTIGVLLIVLTAFALRFWGIWFGLPYSFRADEYHEVFRALQLGTGGFNFERIGKGGYYYLLFVEYGGLFVALKIAGIVEGAQDFARYFVRDPSAFYFIGRLTTAVIGTINVFLAYRVGARAYGIGAGVLAAVFLTFDYLSAEHSHFITVDMPMTCLVTATLLFSVRMVTDGKSSDYKWAALFAALATTTKLPAILLLLPLLIAHFVCVRHRNGTVKQVLLSPNLWWSVGIFAGVLALTNPGIVVSPPLHLLGIGADSAIIGAEEELVEDLPMIPKSLYVYYFNVLTDSLGWPLFIVSVAGVIYAAWKRTAVDVMLLVFGAANYIVFASTESLLYYPRYMLPLIVVLALLAGRLVYRFWPSANIVRQAAVATIVAVLVASPAYRTIANDYLLTQTDTRAIAKDWFDVNVPHGAKVMIEGVKIEPSGLTVPLRDTESNMRANIEYYRKREPGKAKYLSYVLQVDRGPTFDLELARRSDLRDVNYYVERGVRYFVIRPETFAGSRRMGLAGREFLDDLNNAPNIRLIKSFRSDPKSRPGPDIDIYEVFKDGENPDA